MNLTKAYILAVTMPFYTNGEHFTVTVQSVLKGVSSVIPYITYIPVLLFSFEYKIYIVCEGIVCLHVLKHVY